MGECIKNFRKDCTSVFNNSAHNGTHNDAHSAAAPTFETETHSSTRHNDAMLRFAFQLEKVRADAEWAPLLKTDVHEFK